MNLNQLINKKKAEANAEGSDKAVEPAPTTAPPVESKPSVPLKAGLKLGALRPPASSAVSESKAAPTPLKLGGLPKAPTAKPNVAASISDDLDLSSLAALDTSEIPASEVRESSAMQFPDEIEATAPVRELPEDLTAQQLTFIESLDTIYEVLHDTDLLGQSIRMVMQELQNNPEYTKLVSDHDVHTMIKSIRNVMGITKIRKDEKSAKRGTGARKSSASSKFDDDTMAQLDAMMAGSKAFDDE